MVLRQPLFQQNDTTDQSADILRLSHRDFVNERPGIVQSNAMRVSQRGAGANNSVDVAAGAIIVPGTSVTNQGYYHVINDAIVNVPMSTPAHATLPRIDTVIVAVRDQFYTGSNNDAQFVYVAGTAAASPSPPDIAAAGHSNYWRLANISVPANDNTITTADITDVRTSSTLTPAQGAASAVGACVICTSSSRPATPREGQLIWETDTKRLVINEGTPDTPNWQPVSHNNVWTSFTPTFNNVAVGTGGTRVGAFIKLGRLAIARFTFALGSSGFNISGSIVFVPPSDIPMVSIGSGFRAVAFAYATDSSATVRYSGTGSQFSGETVISRFASDGTATGWNATQPFSWASGDSFNGVGIYETSV